MHYTIKHVTHYEYDQRVSGCYNRAHLIPRETCYQQTNHSKVIIHPTPSTGCRHTDYFGNRAYHFCIQEPHLELSIEITTDVNVQSMQRSAHNNLLSCSEILQKLNDPLASLETLFAREFLLDSPMIKRSQLLRNFALKKFRKDRSFCEAVFDLTQSIYDEFEFNPEVTTIMTPLHEVLAKKQGVCQDFAHLAIGCLRSMGFAARYVSGYLETIPPKGQPKLMGADATHAWFAVYVPECGWFEFDPTNNSCPGEQHILTAWGRDYSDVSPLRGAIFGGGLHQRLSVSVDVQRV